MSKWKAKIKNQAGCVWLATSLVTRKTAFLHYLWGKHNYQALFVFRPRTEFMSHFFSILIIILFFFYRIILQDKLHSFNIQDDRSTRFPCTTNYKNNIIKSNLYREFTIRWDCSVRSICHYVVRRVIRGFEHGRIKGTEKASPIHTLFHGWGISSHVESNELL